LEAESLCGNQCRVLAKTVSCSHDRFQTIIGQFPENLQAGNGMGQQSRLSILSQVELVLRVLKGKFRNIVAQGIASGLIDFSDDSIFIMKIATHARVL
jgi:hypothetical protein